MIEEWLHDLNLACDSTYKHVVLPRQSAVAARDEIARLKTELKSTEERRQSLVLDNAILQSENREIGNELLRLKAEIAARGEPPKPAMPITHAIDEKCPGCGASPVYKVQVCVRCWVCGNAWEVKG